MPESLNTNPLLILPDEAATLAFGVKLSHHLSPGQLIFLEGQLGSGKTTCARGILRGFGFSGPVKSPTYTLVESYDFDWGVLYHFDLYRIHDPRELEFIGLREYFSDESIVLVEWAERGLSMLPKPDIELVFQQHAVFSAPDQRSVTLRADTEQGSVIARALFSLFIPAFIFSILCFHCCFFSDCHAKSLPPFPNTEAKQKSYPNVTKKNTGEITDHSTQICNIRIWPSPENTRIVFDLSQALQYQLETSEKTEHMSLLLKNASLKVDVAALKLDNTRIKHIKVTEIRPEIKSNAKSSVQPVQGQGKDIRIEFDLIHGLKPAVFTLAPNQSYGNRLVIDLEMDQNERDTILALFEADAPVMSSGSENKIEGVTLPSKLSGTAEDTTSQKARGSDPLSIQTVQKETRVSDAISIRDPISTPQPIEPVKTLAKKKTSFIVAIDPGHGGEDPGAIGRRGTREKDVVLAISRQLKTMIDKEPNMKGILIRNGDYYVALHERVKRARNHRADLFVSIHADAFHDRRADGASVFSISERGVSSAAARWIAARENRSDLIGGVKLHDKNKVLAEVLLDLSQTKSKEEGYKAAKYILSSMGKIGTLHGGKVEQAGFAVLKAPDIPSLLVETGFISNLKGEAKLRHPEHQRKIARAILEGIRHYARERTH